MSTTNDWERRAPLGSMAEEKPKGTIVNEFGTCPKMGHCRRGVSTKRIWPVIAIERKPEPTGSAVLNQGIGERLDRRLLTVPTPGPHETLRWRPRFDATTGLAGIVLNTPWLGLKWLGSTLQTDTRTKAKETN